MCELRVPFARIHPAGNVVIARGQLLGGTVPADEDTTVAGRVPPGRATGSPPASSPAACRCGAT